MVGEAWYECSLCDARFRNAAHHLRLAAERAGGQAFPCGFCRGRYACEAYCEFAEAVVLHAGLHRVRRREC